MTFFWPLVVTTVFLFAPAYALCLPVGDRASLGLSEPRPTIPVGWALARACGAFTVGVAGASAYALPLSTFSIYEDYIYEEGYYTTGL